MKTSILILILLFPALTAAQNFQGMSEQDMQDIDQAKMQQLEQRSYQFDAELKSLCASGKRDEAQTKALAFSKEMNADATVKQLKKCGELMQGMMPKMSFMEQSTERSGHVCD